MEPHPHPIARGPLVASLLAFSGLCALVASNTFGWLDDWPEPDTFAATVHLRIAGRSIALPSIAISHVGTDGGGYSPISEDMPGERERMNADGRSPRRPISATTVRLLFVPYATFGERGSSRKICPLLSQDWARRHCAKRSTSAWPGIPDEVALYDLSKPAEREPAFDLERRAARRARKSMAVVCDNETTGWCYAAMQVAPGLAAVWGVDGKRLPELAFRPNAPTASRTFGPEAAATARTVRAALTEIVQPNAR